MVILTSVSRPSRIAASDSAPSRTQGGLAEAHHLALPPEHAVAAVGLGARSRSCGWSWSRCRWRRAARTAGTAPRRDRRKAPGTGRGGTAKRSRQEFTPETCHTGVMERRPVLCKTSGFPGGRPRVRAQKAFPGRAGRGQRSGLALSQPRALLAGVQPAGAARGGGPLQPAARAPEVPRHLRQQPGRVLHEAGRRPQAADRQQRARAAARQPHPPPAARRGQRRRAAGPRPAAPPPERRPAARAAPVRPGDPALGRAAGERAPAPLGGLPPAALPHPDPAGGRPRPPLPVHLEPQPVARRVGQDAGRSRLPLRPHQGAAHPAALAAGAEHPALRAARRGDRPQPGPPLPRHGDRRVAPLPRHPQRRRAAQRGGGRGPAGGDPGGAARAALRHRRAAGDEAGHARLDARAADGAARDPGDRDLRGRRPARPARPDAASSTCPCRRCATAPGRR